MALVRLSNDAWGFTSNCFVCEESNADGMRVPFFHDDEAGTVFADIDLTEAFSGAPACAHGGVLMALMDEAMAWATIAVGGVFAMTRTNQHEFVRPVRLGRPYRVTATLVERRDAVLTMAVQITSTTTGKVACSGTASFIALDADTAGSVIGQAVTGADAAFIRQTEDRV